MTNDTQGANERWVATEPAIAEIRGLIADLSEATIEWYSEPGHGGEPHPDDVDTLLDKKLQALETAILEAYALAGLAQKKLDDMEAKSTGPFPGDSRLNKEFDRGYQVAIAEMRSALTAGPETAAEVNDGE